MPEIFQLRVSLLDSNPLIWRKILVSKDTTFFELHHIFQIVMGWKNYHLFEFNVEGYRIAEIAEEEKASGYGDDQLLNSRTVTLKDLITKKDTFKYSYDFGDNWQHLIKVEDFLEKDNNLKYPICIDGQMNCPPEDCGGIGSFYASLEILKDKKHPEYKETAQWFGKSYNLEIFDKEKANLQLKKLAKYIANWNSSA